MRRLTTILLAALLLVTLATAAPANDLTDFVQSPGSETWNAAGEIGNFVLDTFTEPDGVIIGRLNGDVSDAVYFAFDQQWDIRTGIPALPTLRASLTLGSTLEVSDPGVTNIQPIGGVGISLVNIKGGSLVFGLRPCTGDISTHKVDLGPIRFHYTTAIEYRIPVG